jgi:hypothetical protein
MFRSLRSLAAALLLCAGPLAAQNGMAHDSMMSTTHDSEMVPAPDSGMKMMDHGRMMEHGMMMLPHGEFTGANQHVVTGTYQVTEKDGKRFLALGQDFSLDHAPDPYIVLSGTGMESGDRTVNLGRLKRQKGVSIFEIPSGVELAGYTEVVVWCKKFNVTLGHAALASAPTMMPN